MFDTAFVFLCIWKPEKHEKTRSNFEIVYCWNVIGHSAIKILITAPTRVHMHVSQGNVDLKTAVHCSWEIRWRYICSFLSCPVFLPEVHIMMMRTEARIQGTIRNYPWNDVNILYILNKFLDSANLSFYLILSMFISNWISGHIN